MMNKEGYVNNPFWVSKGSATATHTPCGYWYEQPAEKVEQCIQITGRITLTEEDSLPSYVPMMLASAGWLALGLLPLAFLFSLLAYIEYKKTGTGTEVTLPEMLDVAEYKKIQIKGTQRPNVVWPFDK